MDNVIPVCVGQMLVEYNKPSENLSRAKEFIARSSELGCKLVVLPEAMDIGWLSSKAKDLAQPIPGPYFEALAQAARESGIYVVAGLTERSGDKVYDSAVIISNTGELLAKHRKYWLINEELGVYEVGNMSGVAITEHGRVGVTVCADNFPNNLELAHVLARMGAKVIASPSGWGVPPSFDISRPYLESEYGRHWLVGMITLAKLYEIGYVAVSSVGVINGGPLDGWRLIGSSLVVDLNGKPLYIGPQGPDAEALARVDLPLRPFDVKGSTAFTEYLKARGLNIEYAEQWRFKPR